MDLNKIRDDLVEGLRDGSVVVNGLNKKDLNDNYLEHNDLFMKDNRILNSITLDKRFLDVIIFYELLDEDQRKYLEHLMIMDIVGDLNDKR